MASKTITMYAEKKYELGDFKDAIKLIRNQSKLV